MCLGVPGKVIEVDQEMQIATVDFWGVRKQVRLEICDSPVVPGDYILNHVGFAIRRIPPEDAAETLALYDELQNERGKAKLAVALARGKKHHDKRQVEKKRDWQREKSRLMRERG